MAISVFYLMTASHHVIGRVKVSDDDNHNSHNNDNNKDDGDKKNSDTNTDKGRASDSSNPNDSSNVGSGSDNKGSSPIIAEPEAPQKQQEVLPPVTPITNPSPVNDTPVLSTDKPIVEVDPGNSGGGSGSGSGGGSHSSSSKTKDKVNCDNLELTAKEEKKCSEGEGKNINLAHSPAITTFSITENKTFFKAHWSNDTFTSPTILVPKNSSLANQTNPIQAKDK
jgi:hypothetical protein